MSDARRNLLALQSSLLAGLAGAETPEQLRALADAPLPDDLVDYLRARHLANVRDALSQRFAVTARVLSLSDAQLRRHFPSLASLARAEQRITQLVLGLREAIAEHEQAATLGDLLGFERGVAITRLRGPTPLDEILAAIDEASLETSKDPDPAGPAGGFGEVDLGAVWLHKTVSNAPELFFRHDPRDARPLGWQRWIAHVYCEGWSGPRWFEFEDLRALRIRTVMAA